MSNSKYMSQEKGKPGSKLGAKGITCNDAEVYSEERREVSFPNGYQGNLSSPVITHSDGKKKPPHSTSTDESFFTKTETVVEYTRVPMVTMHENAFSKILAPGHTTVSPSHHPAPKVDEYISKVQTEETRTYKTGPLSNLKWWKKPSSNGGTYDYSLPNDSSIKRQSKPSDGSIGSKHFDNPHGRNEKIADGQDPKLIIADGWAKSSIIGKEAPPKGILLAKRTNFMESPTDFLKEASAVMAPAQSHVPPPMVSNSEVFPKAMDSREAARIYGGLSTYPLDNFTTTIDSKQAAWKYRGEML